ncbi:3-oxoacyl-[acyl-carrier-protein] reductase FabG [Neorickettsia helminthoeca str. Oregon]|uniref:3-oxoacyl-[acyl-carrier-protein] reductase FabG n=1 Tax=Neorickettsia helminthoeca str. Oregon TaxID=1286528 RepID=X5HKJ3_9RICK|nr:3-oxoacyl-ACP reductase FabG [Neorickettsia helminthoeca]AHX11564.1 3-oxoacyl-[acyl-carrier-protein] reductase FabG [Neorickettsia helminthoeca str. Oregon]
MEFSLKDKRILITGASGGIGSAIARYLHSCGARLVISGTNEEKLKTLNSAINNDARIVLQDLSDLKNVHLLIEACKNELGGLDGMVCNAGMTDDKLSLRMNLECWQRIIDVNLTSSFILNKHAAALMMREKYGRIVNISSVVAVMGNPGQANYCASKAGMIAMSKSFAREFATKGVLINCIAPGFIKTSMTDKLTDEQHSHVLNGIPMKRIGEPQELCGITAFLLSDMASYITGQTFHVNGGMLMV